MIEHNTAQDPSRRDFLSSTGLFVIFPVFQEPARIPARQGYPTDFNAYLRIGADGRVTCLVGKVELGQGSMTALSQLLAEELDVAHDSVDIIMGDTSVCPWDMGTFGSLAIRQFGPVLRAAGAEARAVLLQMAAERLDVPVDRLAVANGVVTDRSSGKHVSYAELVGGKRIERHLQSVPVKRPTGMKVIGQSPRRKDALEKVTGKAKFAGDITHPGMLYARVLRPPAHGAVLQSADTAAAEKIEGVHVVKDGDLVAVLHERRDIAEKARNLINAKFEPKPAQVDDRSIFDHLMKAAAPGEVAAEGGNLAEGEKLAATVVEAKYLNSYVAHAPIETHSAVAVVENGKATVWAGTQTPFPVRQQVSQALALPLESVRVIVPYVGGGFGGKSASRQALEAARLAKITGKPVQVVWDRAEEFFYDTFRPAAIVNIRSGLTAAGKIAFWKYDGYYAGDREVNQFYDIPHHRTTSSGGWSGGGAHLFGTGPWRAPSVNTHTFARESHIDDLARKAGRDPVEFRLAHLSNARMRRVLEAAAKQFGWKPAPPFSKRGVGVACAIYLGTYVATMAEIALDRATGEVHVKRIVTAQDQGLTVSPDGSRQQIEGSAMMGLGSALTEEVHFKGGEILERNFDTYELPRFSWMPKIESVLIDNPETASSGCGEPPIVTIAAVIANAIHDAAGIRMLQLPMTAARIREALGKA